MNPGTLANIDLNLLYTLHEVARTGSVTAAARALARTQPAISTRLRHLESQLGVDLFERAGPSVRLTPVGRAVVEEVRLLVSQIGAVLDRTRGMDEEPVGTVRIGALPTLCAYLLAPAVHRLTKRHARAKVRMTPGLTAAQIDGVRGGEFDALVSVGRVKEAGLHVVDIGRIEACAVVPSRSRLARGRLSPKKLASAPFIAYGRIGDPFFDSVTSFLERADLLGRISIEVSNIQAIKQLVLEGAGISILPRYTIVEPALATRPVDGLDVSLPLCVVTRPNAERAPIVRELLHELANEVAARKLR